MDGWGEHSGPERGQSRGSGVGGGQQGKGQASSALTGPQAFLRVRCQTLEGCEQRGDAIWLYLRARLAPEVETRREVGVEHRMGRRPKRQPRGGVATLDGSMEAR